MTSRYRRLRGVDRMYLALESPTTPMHFGALVVLDGATLLDADGRLRLAELRQRIDDRVAAVPELRRIVYHGGPLTGAPLWVEDPGFRIEDHVSAVEAPPEACRQRRAAEAELLRFVEHLMGPCLDRSRPLWRLWFITGLAGGRVALLFAIHHAVSDGLGAMALARTILESVSSDAGAIPMPDEATSAIPRRRDLVVDNARETIAALGRSVRPATWRDFARFARSFVAGMSASRHEPRTSLNARVGPGRRLVVARFPSSTARRIARANGGGVNDVILAVAAGGVRALLRQRGEPVGRWRPRAGIAVTLPAAQRDRQSGNHFGSFVVPLPIEEPDPAARVRWIAAERARAKDTQAATQITGVRAWTARFGLTRELMARQRVIQLMETFLAGPPRPVALLGSRVLDIIPIQPLGRNVSLTVVASTYDGWLTVSVRVDPRRFPDLDVLLDAMGEDWQALEDALPPMSSLEMPSLSTPVPA